MEVSAPTGEKRKASASPGEDAEDSDSPIGARRPIKAKILESLDIEEEDNNDNGTGNDNDNDSKDMATFPEVISSEDESCAPVESVSSSSVDTAITRKTTRSGALSGKRRSGKSTQAPTDTVNSSRRSAATASKPRKPVIPEVVPKCVVDLELAYSRQQWIDMDASELGARCLDHLAELDRQRRRCGNLSGDVTGSFKKGNIVVTEIVKAFIERLFLDGDVSALKVENHSLKEEVAALQRKEAAQRKVIEDLTRIVVSLQKDVKALKEGHGPYPAMSPLSLQTESTVRLKSLEKRTERIREKGVRTSSLTPKPADVTAAAMEVDAPTEATPGCSGGDTHVHREPGWTAECDIPQGDPSVLETDMRSNKMDSSNVKTRLKSKASSKSMSRDGAHSPYVRGIRVTANEQLVPPSPSLPPSRVPNAWISVGRDGKPTRDSKRRLRSQASDPVTSISGAFAPGRLPRAGGGRPDRSAKRLVKPAVVIITSKPGGASYAEILSKAKQRVSLKEIGIENTIIRRAMNGAIVIEVPGPQGKQQADLLANSLTVALGEEAKVLNPVAMGEIRLRGIDPSTTEREICDVLEVLGGCPRNVFKVSPINNMRDGMGVV